MNYFKEKYAAVHTLKAARALAVFHLKMDPHCETMKDEAIQQCNNEMCVFKYFLFQASKPKFPCLLHLKTYRALIHNTLVISRTPYTWECPEALLVAFGRNGNWLLLDREHTKKKKNADTHTDLNRYGAYFIFTARQAYLHSQGGHVGGRGAVTAFQCIWFTFSRWPTYWTGVDTQIHAHTHAVKNAHSHHTK